MSRRSWWVSIDGPRPAASWLSVKSEVLIYLQNSMAKVDQIIAEHPDLSLNDLVITKKINADQRAQAQKRPALQASLSQLEEQVTQYKKIDTEYQTRMASDRDTLTASHKSEVEQLRASLKKEAEAEARTTLRKNLLIFSQFLRAAAAKRVMEEDANTEESKAFEGALLLVYGGDDKAVEAAENLIEGADEAVPSVEGQPLSVKCRLFLITDLMARHANGMRRLPDQAAFYRACFVPC